MLDFCVGLPERSLAGSEVLLEEGTTSGELYVLIEGELEVLKEDLQICTVSDPGSVFGEISVLLGYSTPGNFSAAFKRWHGIPPREFRKQTA